MKAMRSSLFVLVLVVCAVGAWAGGPAEKSEDSSMAGNGRQPAMIATSDVENRYRPYNDADFAAATDQVRVYFFHASWCPTCREADKQFMANHSQIPEGVVVFQIDYDRSSALKREFGVTYQHTFVAVDSQGELVRIWHGGDVAEVIKNTADLL